MLTAIVIYIFILHIKAMVFTVYVHRGIGHQYWTVKKPLEHFFRFFLWFSWGFATWPQWQLSYVVRHRKHHAHSDTKDDPHSPSFFSLKQMLDVTKSYLPGYAYYVSPEDHIQYAKDCLDIKPDWIQTNLYNKYPKLGMILFGVLMTLFFGVTGLVIGLLNYFTVDKVTITTTAWLLHRYGYRNGTIGEDKSTNLFPIGWFMAGEELHNNHHIQLSNPNWAHRWYEIDFGYWYARLFIKLGLMSWNQRSGK